jgi:prevent-host-death family protein
MNQHRVKQFNVAEAKAKFSELVDAAARGDATIIAKSGTPVAMLVPLGYERQRTPVKFGTYKGKMSFRMISMRPTRTSSTCSRIPVRSSRGRRNESPAARQPYSALAG